MNPINRLNSANNRDLTQQDGWETPDCRITKNVAQDLECTVLRDIFSTRRSGHCVVLPSEIFRDLRWEVAKMCGVSVLEIFHPYSVENLRDNVNLWWLQDKSHLLDLKMRKLYMKWTLYWTADMKPSKLWSPLKSWLFQASLRDCKNCVHNCEDHSLQDL